MKKLIRLVSVLLVLCMAVTAFASCGDSGTEDETKAGAETGSQKETEAQKEKETDAWDVFMADYDSDYTGREFTIATYPDDDSMIWGDVDWCAEEITGDTLNDAVYTRNKTVEDQLGITIVTAEQKEYASVTTITNSITAGEALYDAVNVTILNAFKMAQSEYLKELNSMGTIDLDASWWDQNCLSDMSIGGQNYVLTGDIGTMYKKSIGVIMFNKVIMESLTDAEDPYELMNNDEWTIEAMTEIGEMVSEDLNGDDKMDENDKYGLIFFCNMGANAMIGAGTKFVTKNEDDIPELTFYSEDTVDILDILGDLLYDTDSAWSWSAAGKNEDTAFAMFKADQALFYYGELHSVAEMRSMDSDFGILCMPKYDEFQSSYYHTINPDVAAVISVTSDVKDADFAGTVLDALGAASKVYLTTAYYDINLQGKVSRDEESTATLDIVISTVDYDIGYLAIEDISTMIKGLVNNRSRDLASKYASNEASFQSALDKIVEAFTD